MTKGKGFFESDRQKRRNLFDPDRTAVPGESLDSADPSDPVDPADPDDSVGQRTDTPARPADGRPRREIPYEWSDARSKPAERDRRVEWSESDYRRRTAPASTDPDATRVGGSARTSPDRPSEAVVPRVPQSAGDSSTAGPGRGETARGRETPDRETRSEQVPAGRKPPAKTVTARKPAAKKPPTKVSGDEKRGHSFWPKTPGKRVLVLCWWGLELAAAVVAGVLLFDRVVMPLVVRHGQEVAVPDIVGLDTEKAVEVLEDAGLEPIQGQGKFSAYVPSGLVLDASPNAGLAVKAGRQVFLTPSLGTENRVVPDLQGLSLRLATQKLQETALQVGSVDYAATDQAAPGQVLASTPGAGSPVPTAGTVSLLMSRQKAAVPFWMPDLSGRQGIETAAWIEACGFAARIDESSFPGDPGEILRQEPGPGSAIWPGTTIHLTVAKDRSFPQDDRDTRRRRGSRR